MFTHVAADKNPVDLDQMMANIMSMPLAMPRFGETRLPEPTVESGRSCIMPYDVEEFARHAYGFAQVYTVAENAFNELRAKYSRAQLRQGDILIIEPKVFGGGLRKREYRDNPL